MADQEKDYSYDETVRALAAMTWRGDFGSGEERRAALGRYFEDVQKQVNLGQEANQLDAVDLEAANGFDPNSVDDLSAEELEAQRIDELAARTWRGDFGNGHDVRKEAIGEADYEKVRARVNDGYEATKDVVLPAVDAPVRQASEVVQDEAAKVSEGKSTPSMQEDIAAGKTPSEHINRLYPNVKKSSPNLETEGVKKAEASVGNSEIIEEKKTPSMQEDLAAGKTPSEHIESLYPKKTTLAPNVPGVRDKFLSELDKQNIPVTDAEIGQEVCPADPKLVAEVEAEKPNTPATPVASSASVEPSGITSKLNRGTSGYPAMPHAPASPPSIVAQNHLRNPELASIHLPQGKGAQAEAAADNHFSVIAKKTMEQEASMA